MSTNNRIGRNPFDKANKGSKAVIAEKASETKEPGTTRKSAAATKVEKTAINDQSKKVLKTSNKKVKQDPQLAFAIQEASATQKSPATESISANQTAAHTQVINSDQHDQNETLAAQIHEEQIIGELIDLPEENWQPLTAAPAGFIKQLFARWL